MEFTKWRGNLGKMNDLSLTNWDQVEESGLINIVAQAIGNKLVDSNNHEFINMVSCDYLGISNLKSVTSDFQKEILKGNPVNLSISSVRIQSKLLEEVEKGLETLFDANCLVTLSASEASSALLPLLASGYFHEGSKPVVVFDKMAHFSLKYIAPICMNETITLEVNKDDIDTLEAICKEYENVVYITDSVYSLGGTSPLEKLKVLQDKYNLYICYDEAHSISIFGENGEGLIRPKYDKLPRNTFILASFNKAFGAAGGAIIMSRDFDKNRVRALGGPMGWSQCISDPVLASIKAALKVHLSGEVKQLQDVLKSKLKIFDNAIETHQSGSIAPIRIIELENFKITLKTAQDLYRKGFYLAPIFFPIVARGKFGLRVMLRSDITNEQLIILINELKKVMK
jgi:7-keto-8-aminopelargonate synthetase-like enzyme